MPGVPRIPPATRAVMAVLVLVPILLTWPMARVFDTHVLAAADQEAAPHIWGLLAAGHTGALLQIETSQCNPSGMASMWSTIYVDICLCIMFCQSDDFIFKSIFKTSHNSCATS